MVKAIESTEEFKTLINSGDIVIVDFWATWCGPCKMISPHFAKLEAKYPNIKFAKVDIEEQPEVAQEQGIKAMPTFKAYKDGNVVDEVTGAAPAKLNELLEKLGA